MERLTYRLYANILMNREIDTDKDYISAGGFTMTMAGREVTFDFHLTAAKTDAENKRRISLECEDPMYEYEQTDEITKEMLGKVTLISDFFIFTGENNETDLAPVKLLDAAFYLPDEDIQLDIPEDVVENASLGSCVTP